MYQTYILFFLEQTIISAFPLLLRSYEEKFLQLLAKDVIPFNEQLLEILAKEGSNIYIELRYCFLTLMIL